MKPQTVNGKDGWIFLNEFGRWGQLDKMAREEDVSYWKRVTERRAEHSRSLGAEFLTLVAPEKASVYSDMLPESRTIHPDRISVALSREIGSRFLYPFEAIRLSPTQTYEIAESHWNDVGAYIGYAETCRALTALSGIDIPIMTEPEYYLGGDRGFGDLGEQPVRWNHVKTKTPGHVIFDNKIWSRGNVKVAINPECEHTLVTFRDSFLNQMCPYLVRSFRRIVMVSSWHYLEEIVESERPTFVLLELTERYLSPAPLEPKAESFLALCQMTVEEVKKNRARF